VAAFRALSPLCLVSEGNHENSVGEADLGAEVGTSQIRITNFTRSTTKFGDRGGSVNSCWMWDVGQVQWASLHCSYLLKWFCKTFTGAVSTTDIIWHGGGWRDDLKWKSVYRFGRMHDPYDVRFWTFLQLLPTSVNVMTNRTDTGNVRLLHRPANLKHIICKSTCRLSVLILGSLHICDCDPASSVLNVTPSKTVKQLSPLDFEMEMQGVF